MRAQEAEMWRGIDLLRFNEEGLICEIPVMVRPLSGVTALAGEMVTALALDQPS